MARSALLLLFAVCFMAVVIVGNASSRRVTGGEGSLSQEQCGPACDFRCSKASNHEPCLKYCNLCCAKCLCVPSGTFGNKEECPCYNNWKSDKGTPKCP